MISPSRYEEIYDNFRAETSEEWAQEWRDDLEPAEAALIRVWDKRTDEGMLKMCQRILEAEKKEDWRPL